MKKRKTSSIVKTTLLTGAIALGANLIANDLTPGSWSANAETTSSEKKVEKKCGNGECGKKKVQKKSAKKSAKKTAKKAKKKVNKKVEKKVNKEASCGAEKGCAEGKCGSKKDASKKGSQGSCGEETCGA